MGEIVGTLARIGQGVGPQWAGTGVLGALMQVAVRPGSQGGPSGGGQPLLFLSTARN